MPHVGGHIMWAKDMSDISLFPVQGGGITFVSDQHNTGAYAALNDGVGTQLQSAISALRTSGVSATYAWWFKGTSNVNHARHQRQLSPAGGGGFSTKEDASGQIACKAEDTNDVVLTTTAVITNNIGAWTYFMFGHNATDGKFWEKGSVDASVTGGGPYLGYGAGNYTGVSNRGNGFNATHGITSRFKAWPFFFTNTQALDEYNAEFDAIGSEDLTPPAGGVTSKKIIVPMYPKRVSGGIYPKRLFGR